MTAISFKAMLSGILSFPRAGLSDFFAPMGVPLIQRGIVSSRGITKRGWTPRVYPVAGPGSREAARRRRQAAYFRQIASHLPGTVQPRHIFGEAADAQG